MLLSGIFGFSERQLRPLLAQSGHSGASQAYALSDAHDVAGGSVPPWSVPGAINQGSRRNKERRENQVRPVQVTVADQIPNEHGSDGKQDINVGRQGAVWHRVRKPLNAVKRSRKKGRTRQKDQSLVKPRIPGP